MAKKNNIEKFEINIGYDFKDKNLLKQVFVHRSYLNENPKFNIEHNERLEFLGDAVLELVVTEYLYKKYKNPEGELTNWRSALVCGQMLSKIADEIQINENLLLSKGETQSTGKARQIILANTFEALIGALYLDGGYEAAKKLINNKLILYLPEILENELFKDNKSKLQEISQEINSATPVYKTLSESGPDHNKLFKIGVYINEKLYGEGEGHSKQEAEQNAAMHALMKIDLS